MGEVTESDWKLFKELLPKWQESYMETVSYTHLTLPTILLV